MEFPDFSDSDESDNQVPQKTVQQPVLTPMLPVAPSFSIGAVRGYSQQALDRSGPPAVSAPPACEEMVPGAALISAVNTIFNTNTPELFSNQNLSVDGHVSNTPRSREAPCDQHKQNRIPRRQEQHDNFQRTLLTKLDAMAETQAEALSILKVLLSATRGVGGNDILEDVLPNPVDNVDDLEALSSRLVDEEFKKKILQFLVAVCGHNCGVSTRRILGNIGTNKLWSQYSLKGRKSKRSFKDLTICKMVIKACLRVHKSSNEVDVEEQISEYLKHAPNKAGGSRCKDRERASAE